MMNFSELAASMESRARHLQALAAAGWALLIAAGTLLGIAGSLWLWTDWLPFSAAHVALLAALPVLAAGIIYLAECRKKLNRARLLLKLDFALGLNAGLSSLNELRTRGEDSILYGRIEASVAPRLQQWRRGLPIRIGAVGPLLVGAAFLASAIVLSVAPLHTQAEIASIPEATTALSEGVVSASVSETSAVASDTVEDRVDPSESSESGSSPSISEYSLDNILADLGVQFPFTSTTVEESRDAYESLVPSYGQIDPSLVELLARIEQRVGIAGGGLTLEEKRALQGMMDSAPPPVARALEQILAAADSQELRRGLDDFAAARDLSEAVPDQAVTTSTWVQVEDVFEQDADVSRAPLPHTPQADEATALPAPLPSAAGTESDESVVPGDQDQLPTTESDEGPPVPVEQQLVQLQTLQYVTEQVRSTVGEMGTLDEFLTRGVPVELPGGTAAPAASVTVSFEQMKSLLTERGLPGEALETVRKYFESITEGGS
jgi:hypothetical protein